MQKELIKKDILLLLKDFKFQVFFIIMLILFLLSGISSANNLKKRQNDFQQKMEFYKSTANNQAKSMMGLLSGFALMYLQEPASSDLVIENIGFPIILKTDINHFVPRPEQYNKVQSKTFDLNWLFIIGIIGSFMVLIFSFDALSEEKLHGMLKLQTLNGLTRTDILFSKFFSILLLYLFTIIPASIVSLLAFTAITSIFSFVFFLKLALFILLSLPLMAFFILIGLWISMSKNYLTNVVIALTFWLIFIIIIPQLASIVGKRLVPLKSNTEMMNEKGEAYRNLANKYADLYGTKYQGNGNLKDGIRARCFDNLDIVKASIDEKHRKQYLRQISTIQKLSMLSPYSIFKYMNEILFDKNLYRLTKDIEHLNQIQLDIKKQLVSEDKKDHTSLHLCYNEAEGDKYAILSQGLTPFSSKPFPSPEKLVASSYNEDSFSTKLKQISFPLIMLFFIDLFILIIITLKFKKFDIR